ncbi:MAG: AI-2E family transporter [Pirellulaceae bacterium]
MNDDVRNRVSPTSLLVVALLIALVLAACDLLTTTLALILLIFAGLLFGIFLNSLAGGLSNHSPLNYTTGYFIIVVVMLVLIGLGFFYLGSQVVQRADQLWSELGSAAERSREKLMQYESAKQWLPDADQMQQMVTQNSSSVLPKMLSGLQIVGWGITGALVMFFVGLYAAYDPSLYRRGMIKLVPLPRRQRTDQVLDKCQSALRRWIVGRLMSMALVGILTAIGLWFLNVPLPITLGVVAALLTFIPNFGPILAAVPQVLLAINVDTNTAIWVIAFNIALQGVESYLLTPMIQRHEVSLPPILTIAAQLLMGIIAGVIGVMMAAPLVVVIMVSIQMLYIHDRLGDENPGKLTTELS